VATHADPQARPTRPAWRDSLRASWVPFLASRLAVFGVAIWISVSDLTPKVAASDAYPRLSHPFAAWPAGSFLDLLLSPLAKWDALHYVAISFAGYASTDPSLPPASTRAAFFPLYPGIVRVLSGFGASPGLILIVAYLVSLACFLGALVLLHRLTAIELGDRFARPTLMLFAFFPTAFFFGIPYTESLFVLLALGAFLAARQGRWALAGIAMALASATRSPGLLLLVPVVLLYLYGPRADREPRQGGGWRPRFAIRPDAAWMLLAPVGIVLFSLYQRHVLGDALAWDHAQVYFGRHTIDPLTGSWHGIRDGWEGLSRLLDGSHAPGSSFDELNFGQLVLFVFAVGGGIAMLRTLPVAYGAWVLVSLLPILASQPDSDPLYSSARFIGVLFPLFMWLAVLCERRKWTTAVVAVSAAGMAVLTAEFALWSFVA
jgi:hypothetical protein